MLLSLAEVDVHPFIGSAFKLSFDALIVFKKNFEILPQHRWKVPTFTYSASYLEALSRL